MPISFDPGTWWLVALLAGAAIGVIGYFLKRTMAQVDGHDKDIQIIKQHYATEQDVKDLQEDVKDIQQNYGTKQDIKELRTEIKDELTKISGDMDEIKQNSISKVDFYRALSDTNDTVKNIYNLLIQQKTGGKPHDP